jgi:hypothetical protein
MIYEGIARTDGAETDFHWPPQDGLHVQITTWSARGSDRQTFVDIEKLIELMAADPYCVALWSVARASEQLHAAREALRRLKESDDG